MNEKKKHFHKWTLDMLLIPYPILITSYNNIFWQVHSSSLIAVNKRESKHPVYITTPGNGNSSLSSEWTPVDSTDRFHPARHYNCSFFGSSMKQHKLKKKKKRENNDQQPSFFYSFGSEEEHRFILSSQQRAHSVCTVWFGPCSFNVSQHITVFWGSY